jgi:hypothetical protein
VNVAIPLAILWVLSMLQGWQATNTGVLHSRDEVGRRRRTSAMGPILLG